MPAIAYAESQWSYRELRTASNRLAGGLASLGIRRGDRVLIKTKTGQLLARQLIRQSALKVELGPINPGGSDEVLDTQGIVWTSRIVWASQ